MEKENESAKVSLTPEKEHLVTEIKRLDSETTKTKLRNAYLIGKEINQFHEKEYGEDTFQMLSEKTGINKHTLYKCSQVAKEFNDTDIDILCNGGHFPLALKHVKPNLKFGRDKIMEIHAQADTIKEFKEAFAALRAEETQEKNPPEFCPLGTILDSPPNVVPTEAKTDFLDDDRTNDRHNQGIVEEMNENLAPDTEEITETESNPADPVEDPTAISSIPKKAESGSDSETEETQRNNNEIKRTAGSTTNTTPPADTTGGTPEDILQENSIGNQFDSEDEMVAIAKAELDQLKKENEDLKLTVDRLNHKNNELNQTNKMLSDALEAQMAEKDVEYA